MKISFTVEGREVAVDVVRSDGRTALVSVDGQPRQIEVAASGRGLSLIAGGRSHDVDVLRDRGGSTVWVDGLPFRVSVASGGRPAAVGGTRGARGGEVANAPMPGRVVRVLVGQGDRVSEGQGLVVVEAMKMENEVKARASGSVLKVMVAEGSSVEQGQPLVVVSPAQEE
jgi:biotin carboxyl carrier protein